MLVITDAGRMLSFFWHQLPTDLLEEIPSAPTQGLFHPPKPKFNGLGETPPFTLMSPKINAKGTSIKLNTNKKKNGIFRETLRQGASSGTS